MKRKVYLLFITLLIICSCKNENEGYKVSYKNIVKNIKSSYKEKNYKKTKKYLKKYLNKSKRDGEILYTGKGYRRLGFYYQKFNQIDSAYYFYSKSTPFFKRSKDSLRLGKVFTNMAIIESDYDDYIKSDSTAIEALKIFNNKGTKYISSIYNCLGINSRKKEEYKNAIKFYDKAINFSKNQKNKLEYESNKANIYRDLKEYSKSIDILKKILKDSILQNHPKTRARILSNLAYVKWLENSKNGEVLSQFIKAKLIREKENDFNGLKASYAHLSDYYYDLNERESLKYAYKMYNISKKEKSPNDVMEAIDKIILIERSEKALIYAKERIQIKDSLELAKDKSQHKYALIKYESEENEKLAIRNKLLAEQQKTQKLLWLFFGITTVIGFIIYFFYKNEKTKKEKIEEVYKTETRLAKKIHDELANDVYHTMNKVQNKNISSEEVLINLQKIYSQTRDISHENSLVMTGDYFEDFLKQLFLDFTTDTCKIMSKDLSKIAINTFTKEQQIVIYRALRELLINMQKHSNATLVVISFSIIKGVVQIQYKDNGIGIKHLKIKNGLQNMETRIKLINGSITFETEKQKGFKSVFQFKK